MACTSERIASPIIIFATNKAAPDPVRERVQRCGTCLESGEIRPLDGGWIRQRRTIYLIANGEEGLAAFGSPQRRFPDHAKSWFTEASSDIPHDWAETKKLRSISTHCVQISRNVLQMDERACMRVGTASRREQGVASRMRSVCWRSMPLFILSKDDGCSGSTFRLLPFRGASTGQMDFDEALLFGHK